MVSLIREHEHAVICDLRRFYGVRLTDMYMGRENPFEVALYVYDCQYIEGSALHRALLGDDSDWNTTNQLLAMVADHLAVANWFQTKDGQKGKNRPKQIPRPGVRDEEETTYGKGTAMSREDMAAWLGWDGWK